MKKIFLISFFICTVVFKVNAVDVSLYQDIKDNGTKTDKLAIEWYIKGLWSGYFWYPINHKVIGKGKKFEKNNPSLYCVPADGKIKGKAQEFIDAEILYQKQNNELYDDDSLEIILAQYLNRTFPCK